MSAFAAREKGSANVSKPEMRVEIERKARRCPFKPP